MWMNVLQERLTVTLILMFAQTPEGVTSVRWLRVQKVSSKRQLLAVARGMVNTTTNIGLRVINISFVTSKFGVCAVKSIKYKAKKNRPNSCGYLVLSKSVLKNIEWATDNEVGLY